MSGKMLAGALRGWFVLALVALLVAGCGGGNSGSPSTPPPPPSIVLTTLSPDTAVAGSGDLIVTATGSGYTTSSVVKWNGIALTTNYVSATSLTATVPATDLTAPASVAVTVTDSSEGDAGSAAVQFTVTDQTAPTIATLNPSSVLTGTTAFTLTVNGTNFASSAKVLWNGSALPTTYDSTTQLTAQVAAAQVANVGSASVTVQNDTAAAGSSNVSKFTVVAVPPPPSLVSVTPNTLPAYSTGSLTIVGRGFSQSTLVLINGQIILSTYNSATQLTVGPVQFPTMVGPAQLTVEDPASAYIPSNALTLTFTQPVAVVSGLSPASVLAAQGAMPLTVSGQFFTSTAVVYFNGSARPTSLNNQGQLVAQLTAQDVATAGTEVITVEDPASANVPSNAMNFIVQSLPALTLTTLSPATVPAGNSTFTLTVIGTGFTINSAIAWNGSSLTTTYVSSTLLTASIDATKVASIGTAAVTVANPVNQGGTSSPLTLTIPAPSKDAVSYQINNGHNGFISFNNVSLPAAASWSVDLGGQPSYALVVGGTVFVTASVNGNSQLSALNGATGATVWGPIAFAGVTGLTYDNGKLFITSGSYITQGILTAVSPSTGNPLWSATIPGSFATQSPPVASEGLVYTLDDGDLTAFDENTGGQVWMQGVSGTNGAPAATVDGIYVAPVCFAIDLQPATGSIIWTHNTGCEGGGGNTPAVGSGIMYAPLSAGYYGGNTYATETGQIIGAFSLSAPPAISTNSAFVLYNSTLQGLALSNNQVLWSFAGDGTLITAPVVVDNYVFVGSTNGNLYALDATTGAQLWTKNLGAAISGPATGGNANQGATGLAAGDGLLIVPAGNKVNAFVLSTNP